MRKIIYVLLTCLIFVGVIYGAFQLFFAYRTLQEDYPYRTTPPSDAPWFVAEIINVTEHGIKAQVIEPVSSESNVVKTIGASISENTIIKDKDGNRIDIASLTVGQKVLVCVVSGVYYENCVSTDTIQHTAYIGCYEIQVMN